jgi:hypothetical protein
VKTLLVLAMTYKELGRKSSLLSLQQENAGQTEKSMSFLRRFRAMRLQTKA